MLMPYESEAQRGYFNANRAKLEAQGVDVDEWNHASKGMKLPKKAPDAYRKTFIQRHIKKGNKNGK